jgi:hypothetical protein
MIPTTLKFTAHLPGGSIVAKRAGSACACWQKKCYRHKHGFCSPDVLDCRTRGERHVGQLDTRHDFMAFEQAFLGSDTLLELFYDTVRSILSSVQ